MSWWTKNRKKVGILAGLLGAGAATVASGGTAAPLFGGLLGATEGPAAGVGLAEALAASKGVGEAAAATKGGIDAAIAAEGASEMGLAGTKAVSDAYFGAAAPAVQKTTGLLGMSPKSAGTAMMGMSLLGSGQQQPPPAPPPPPAAPPPQSSFAGYGDQPPPGIDPMTWAQMPEHLKKQLRGGMQA